MLSKIRLIPIVLLLVASNAGAISKDENLPRDEFARRRAIFLEELRELNACAIFHSAPVFERNHDIDYAYRQDSDFYYLTGWTQREAILVLAPQQQPGDDPEISFFTVDRDPKKEVWTGPKLGVGDARILPGIDRSYPLDEFYPRLEKLFQGYDRLVISFGNNGDFKHEFETAFEALYLRPDIVQNASSLLKSHRLIKSEAEISSLENAIEITHQALLDALPVIPTLEFEYEVQALLEYGFAKRGSHRLGFPSIVGAGKNATFLHYEDNRGALETGELILMDIGAEWDYYSADISRTVPVSGKFTPEQKAIYQLVLDAQQAAIQTVKPGVSWRKPHDTAVKVLTTGLIELGLLSGDPDDLIRDKSYRKYFMHGTSHWLGLDVHDVGGRNDDEGQPINLKAGMVLTVEPGLYIIESEDVDQKWWNIGIRIEDDVLVTQRGHRVLSQSVPKTIQEIETLMQP